MVNHRKYNSNRQSYAYIRRTSDRLCRENGLSVVQPSRDKAKSYAEWDAGRKGKSWKAKLKAAIDAVIPQAKDFDDFLRLMAAQGYEIKQGKFISFRAPGQVCVGMNGAGNRKKIAALLRERKEPGLILLAPDNDRAGDTWAQALLAEFPWLYRCPPIPVGKDLNDLLLSDREEASAYLSAAVDEARSHQPAPYTDSSAVHRLESLRQYILSQAAKPRLSTGFPSLDEALDGGLYEGLYILGAVSSLGKTAFCMQIADALARQGQDVLIFSLEMSEYELFKPFGT